MNHEDKQYIKEAVKEGVLEALEEFFGDRSVLSIREHTDAVGKVMTPTEVAKRELFS